MVDFGGFGRRENKANLSLREQSQSAAFGRKYDSSGFVAGRLLPRFIRKKEWTGAGVTI
jgi:hypothetical protein